MGGEGERTNVTSAPESRRSLRAHSAIKLPAGSATHRQRRSGKIPVQYFIQRRKIDWLEKVFVATSRHRQGPMRGRIPTGHYHDRNIFRARLSAQMTGDRDAIQPGQAYVHQYQVGFSIAGGGNSLNSIVGLDNAIALQLEKRPQHETAVCVIIDNENSRAR